jgi:hypothetical protein
MGNISYFCDEELKLNCSFKQFLIKYLAVASVCYQTEQTGWSKVEKEEVDELKLFIDKYEKLLTDEELVKCNKLKVFFRISEFPRCWPYQFQIIKIDEVNETISLEDLNGRKIQGYWYDPTCEYLYYLWYCGVRGYVMMNEEQNQDFEIRFEEDNIYVDFYPVMGYPDYDESDDDEKQPQPKYEIEDIIRLNVIAPKFQQFYEDLKEVINIE